VSASIEYRKSASAIEMPIDRLDNHFCFSPDHAFKCGDISDLRISKMYWHQ
jgi:hypothetical protein